MSSFFQRLARPTVHSIRDALIEATKAANDPQWALDQDGDFWIAFLAEIRDEPEGVQSWRGGKGEHSSAVGLAWWTDPHGSRHFVVRGDSSGLPQMRGKFDFAPVWHICPERIIRRERNGSYTWLALCDCGACGRPESIGWDGDRCGDCHLGRTSSVRPGMVGTLRDDMFIEHLLFSPDSSLLAAAGQGRVSLWETGTPAMRGQLERVFPQVQGLIFDHDGGRIGVAGGDRLLRWFDVETGEEKESIPIPKDIVYLGLSSDGKTLAACGKLAQEVWRRDPSWRFEFSLGDNCESSALSADGSVLLVSGKWKRILYDLEARHPSREAKPLRSWDVGTWDGLDCVLTFNSHTAVSVYRKQLEKGGAPSGYWVALADLRTGSLRWPSSVRALRSPRFNSTGLWLAGYEEVGVVFMPVYDAPLPITLGPEIGSVVRLAFAPDDETIALGGTDGVIRLWPWRRMLVA